MELQETKVKCQNKDHSGKLSRMVGTYTIRLINFFLSESILKKTFCNRNTRAATGNRKDLSF